MGLKLVVDNTRGKGAVKGACTTSPAASNTAGTENRSHSTDYQIYEPPLMERVSDRLGAAGEVVGAVGACAMMVASTPLLVLSLLSSKKETLIGNIPGVSDNL